MKKIIYLISEPFVPDLVSIRSQQILFLKSHAVNILDFEGHTIMVGTLEFFISSLIPSTLPIFKSIIFNITQAKNQARNFIYNEVS